MHKASAGRSPPMHKASAGQSPPMHKASAGQSPPMHKASAGRSPPMHKASAGQRRQKMINDVMDELINRLTDAEREEWSRLDEKINSKQLELLLLKLEKLGFIQKICREKGLIAENLEDLKSESGELFKEVSWHLKYRRALASNGMAIEDAYCCYNNFKQRNGCGWVKGRPIKEKQDYSKDIFGVIFRCRICDRILEEKVL